MRPKPRRSTKQIYLKEGEPLQLPIFIDCGGAKSSSMAGSELLSHVYPDP